MCSSVDAGRLFAKGGPSPPWKRPNLNRTLTLLAVLAAAALLYRTAPAPAVYLELDSAIYLRAAADYARAPQPHYTAAEYWPPLYPMLAGAVTAVLHDPLQGARVVSTLAGWLTMFPAFLLARRLWGDGAGLAAAALVGLHPLLAWYARVPRVESLFLLLDACALAGVLGRRPTLGGACLGFAYWTRFDALLLVPGTLLAARSGRRAALAGFLLAAAPYLVYLAWLNGGTPTIITPQKAVYDTLEGVWTKSGGSMYEFTTRYGTPGMVKLPPGTTVPPRDVTGLLLDGVKRLPNSLAEASWNWMPLLLLPAALALAHDPTTRRLLWLFLPVPFYALLSSWDPNARYYAFSILPLALLAARGLQVPTEVPAPQARRILVGVAAPVLVGASWLVPGLEHFDGRTPVEACFVSPTPPVFLAGFGTAALLAWRIGPRAGLLGAAAALVVNGMPSLPDLYRGWVPLMALLLALLPAPAWLTLPKSLWGPGLARWVLAWFLVLALQNAGSLAAWDLAHARTVHNPAVARFLQDLPPGTRVLSFLQVDVLRTGLEWVPMPFFQRPSQVLERTGADYVLLTIPEGNMEEQDSGRGTARDLERTGQVRLVLEAPATAETCPRWFRIYRRL